jgi:hypothetical protein
MRIAALLPCLLLTACLATGEQPAPEASAVAAAPAAEPSAAAAKPRPSSTRGGGSAADGGTTTSATRVAPPSTDPEERKDPLTQARVDCWMKLEHEKGVRDIDRRIVFVDKCVAEAMKRNP